MIPDSLPVHEFFFYQFMDWFGLRNDVLDYHILKASIKCGPRRPTVKSSLCYESLDNLGQANKIVQVTAHTGTHSPYFQSVDQKEGIAHVLLYQTLDRSQSILNFCSCLDYVLLSSIGQTTYSITFDSWP